MPEMVFLDKLSRGLAVVFNKMLLNIIFNPALALTQRIKCNIDTN